MIVCMYCTAVHPYLSIVCILFIIYYSIDESPSSGLPELSRARSSSSSETIHHTPPLISDALRRALSPQPLPIWGGTAEPRPRVSPRVGKMEGDRTRPNSMAFLLEPGTEFVKQSVNRRSKYINATMIFSIVYVVLLKCML